MAKEVERPQLLAAIEGFRQREGRTLLVAIDGRGGAGKSALAEWLQRHLPLAVVVHVDDFGRPGIAYDDWDWDRLREQVLEPMQAGRRTRYQVFDWNRDVLGDWQELQPVGIVIVEGVSILRHELGDPWDVRVWVEAPFELRLERGVARDGEPMRSTWLDEWMPQEDEYVARQNPLERADFLVRGDSGE
jgi:uridine kinase